MFEDRRGSCTAGLFMSMAIMIVKCMKGVFENRIKRRVQAYRQRELTFLVVESKVENCGHIAVTLSLMTLSFCLAERCP